MKENLVYSPCTMAYIKLREKKYYDNHSSMNFSILYCTIVENIVPISHKNLCHVTHVPMLFQCLKL